MIYNPIYCPFLRHLRVLNIIFVLLPVKFKAVIPTVGHNNMSVICDTESLRSVEWARESVDKREEGTLGVKDLDAGVSPVGHQYVVLLVHGHAGGRVKLTVALAVGAETKKKLAFCIKNLENISL